MASMKKIIVFTLMLMISKHSLAMGAKRPSSGTNQGSDSNNTPIPTPTINMGPKLSHTDYLDSASLVGAMVDDSQNNNELINSRNSVNEDRIDQCFDQEKTPENFSEQINYYVYKMLDDTKAYVGGIGSLYGTNSNNEKYFPVNLMRHPLCSVTKDSLAKTLTSSKVPDQVTIDRINHFAITTNNLRIDAINGDVVSKKRLMEKWSRFYSCLGYVESLSSADSEKSNQVARKYASEDYQKPAGVKFYEDPYQNESSRLNIGIYQFTPSLSNNIAPCVKAWNEWHKNKSQCQITGNLKTKDIIKVVGSSLQSFNTFCGIHKMIQTFAIQVNTNKTSATHPDNLVNGKLKSFEQRCVSPHFQSGKAYVHFGPFMNSTGKNLKELFTCIENSDR